MWNDKRNLGLAAAFLVLGGIAVAGWVRHAEPTPVPVNALMDQNGYSATAPVGGNSQPGYAETVAPGSYAVNRSYRNEPEYQNPYAGSSQYAGSNQEDGYYSTVRRPVFVRPAAPPQGRVIENQPVEREYSNEGNRRVYRTELHHGRSTKKSVAIVAGSAGAGAAIGAIAGGGKGAAIGALSGGGAGFVYDRLTHNH